MRSQIRGLDMASKNSQDAISLIQTAEGGMQEIDNMVQRIRELVVYAANDTQTSDDSNGALSTDVSGASDRQKIQDEINQLMVEIDSMANRVEFNKKKVINGTFSEANSSGIYFQVGANADQGWTLNIGAITCSGLGIATGDVNEIIKGATTTTSSYVAAKSTGTSAMALPSVSTMVSMLTQQVTINIVSGSWTSTLTSMKALPSVSTAVSTLTQNVTITSTIQSVVTTTVAGVDLAGTGGTANTVIDVMKATGSGPLTQLLNTLDTAIRTVTTERAKLGAAQNRLEYTTKSLDISSENLSASESRIRDADMGKEMMKLTAANVLQQAGVAMLAQANQSPQNILQLLR